jgi:release factor glutamine methyltransferase
VPVISAAFRLREHGPVIAFDPRMTLRQAICAARDQLASVDDLRPTAAQDAEHLLLHALSLPRTTIYAYPSRLLNAHEQATYAAVIDRRLQREPVQYITGVQEFFGLPLAVSPAVLIPRPETELLVEAAIDRLPQDRPLRVADVGTGSGAIAIAIASRMPQVEVTAIDISPEALSMARENAARNHVSAQVHLLESDLLAALPHASAPFDAILSNPPYVPEADRDSLHPQVRDFEPARALFAGECGLEVYQRLIPQAGQHLSAAGLLAMELGAGQRDAIAGLLREWRAVQFLNDLQGIPRVVLARLP